MQIRLTSSKGFINHDMNIEGVSVLQYWGVVLTDSGQKLATISDHTLPGLLRKLNKNIIKLNEDGRA